MYMSKENKIKQLQEQFFQLLRLSMGLAEQKDFEATAEDWKWLYKEADRQTLTGVIYGAVAQLPANQQPPVDLLMQWICEVDVIKGMNKLLNQESARLTKLFSDAGRRTAILKGQANARLYPDKFLRQPGDIDIWVEGGRDSVLALLQEEPFVSMTRERDKPFFHHAHIFVKNKTKVDVHFRPGTGNYNPFTSKRMEGWLNAEIMNTEVVEEGFNVPSVRFALVMQLAHVQRHILSSGIGLRQICDYFMLLKHSTEADRRVVAERLKSFGLRHSAGALMWVLGEVFQMDSALMLCDPDSYRGEWLLRVIMTGGNFGKYAQRRHQGLWRRFFAGKLRHLRLMPFIFWEVFWLEMKSYKGIVLTLPERIRGRSFSLREARKRNAMKLPKS